MNQIKAYAVDFGTSNSLLTAVGPEDQYQSVLLDGDDSILRSVLYFPPNGEATFGLKAVKAYAESGGEGRLIRSIKKYLPAKSFNGTRIGQKMYSLEELIARFLREMKERADQRTGQEVDKVILGRPARFSFDDEADQLAQDRLEKAARLSGFKNVEFFAEPLAAAYDFRRTLTNEKLVLVVDLGGGTSDFTVIRLGQNKAEVLSLGGISVAGDALDGAIMSNHLAPHFGSEVIYQLPMSGNRLQMPPDLKERLQSPADITLMSKSDMMDFYKSIRRCRLNAEDEEKMERLFTLVEDNLGFAIFEAIEACKVAVCGSQDVEAFQFDYPTIELSSNYSYDEFVDNSRRRIDKIFNSLNQVLEESGCSESDIDLICCTGGTSKVPEVHKRLQEKFGGEKIQTRENFHSVIQGLAERAQEVY